jgi:hypothetical protein
MRRCDIRDRLARALRSCTVSPQEMPQAARSGGISYRETLDK